MRRFYAAVAAFGFAVPAASQAAPVFLNCTVDSAKGNITKVDVQLNEEGGTVSYSFPDMGRSYTVRAIFAPEKVSFGAFVVSRTDLSFVRINNGEFDQSVFSQRAGRSWEMRDRYAQAGFLARFHYALNARRGDEHPG